MKTKLVHCLRSQVLASSIPAILVLCHCVQLTYSQQATATTASEAYILKSSMSPHLYQQANISQEPKLGFSSTHQEVSTQTTTKTTTTDTPIINTDALPINSSSAATTTITTTTSTTNTSPASVNVPDQNASLMTGGQETAGAKLIPAQHSEVASLEPKTEHQLQQQQYHLTSHIEQAIRSQPHCILGDDTFQLGERWNPNLPPFGVQVCVLCECTVRSRKSCYETKVTCRRITNECPVIDSCPDGKKPVTQPGQCCKSCQHASQQLQPTQSPSASSFLPAYESAQSENQQHQQPQTPLKIVYMNERTKDYLSVVKDLPACMPASLDTNQSGPSGSGTLAPTALVTQSSPASIISQPPSVLASASVLNPGTSKNSKSTRNDLNGIDTRLAFKSLHDSAPQFISSQSSTTRNTEGHGKSALAMEQAKRRPGGNTATGATSLDNTSDPHQHPNDVQLTTTTQSSVLMTIGASSNSNNNNINRQFQQQYHTNPVVPINQPHQQQAGSGPSSVCLLGNDTFQVGDVWRPILPPHGVQVCVQCNCIFRLRKGCYETKVTCRRTHRDCPTIEICQDGQAPVLMENQCCKTCPPPADTGFMIEQQHQQQHTLNTLPPPETIQRNEKVFREFQNISKNLNACMRSRESVDIYQTNRYAKRSHTRNYLKNT